MVTSGTWYSLLVMALLLDLQAAVLFTSDHIDSEYGFYHVYTFNFIMWDLYAWYGLLVTVFCQIVKLLYHCE